MPAPLILARRDALSRAQRGRRECIAGSGCAGAAVQRGFEAFAIVLFLPAFVCILLWGYVWWLSSRRESRVVRWWAALSAVFSLLGALAFVRWTGIEDYNDYPGYTCTVRE